MFPLTCSGVESGKPTHFTVLTKGAGKAPLDVSFSSPVKDFDIVDNYDYSQTVKYTPVQQVSPIHDLNNNYVKYIPVQVIHRNKSHINITYLCIT